MVEHFPTATILSDEAKVIACLKTEFKLQEEGMGHFYHNIPLILNYPFLTVLKDKLFVKEFHSI